MKDRHLTRRIMTSLLCLLLGLGFFPGEAEAAQGAVRPKELNVIPYMFLSGQKTEIDPQTRTEFVYDKNGNLKEEIFYDCSRYDGEEICRGKNSYYDNGVLRSASGMQVLQGKRYESHYDSYGHFMEPSAEGMVECSVYSECGCLFPFEGAELRREYDKEGRLTRFEIEGQESWYDMGATRYTQYREICEYVYDDAGRIFFVYDTRTTEGEENPVVTTRVFEYAKDGSYRCRYSGFDGKGDPKRCLMEFLPDGRLSRVVYGTVADPDPKKDHDRLEFEFDGDGDWIRVTATEEGEAWIDYELKYRKQGDRILECDVFSNIETRLWDYPVPEGLMAHMDFEYDRYGNLARVRTKSRIGMQGDEFDLLESEYRYEYESVRTPGSRIETAQYGRDAARSCIESWIHLW